MAEWSVLCSHFNPAQTSCLGCLLNISTPCCSISINELRIAQYQSIRLIFPAVVSEYSKRRPSQKSLKIPSEDEQGNRMLKSKKIFRYTSLVKIRAKH